MTETKLCRLLRGLFACGAAGRRAQSRRWEGFGSVQNLFDRVAPLDPLTYGAQVSNQPDYAGAVGRYFTPGARYSC